MSYDEHLISMAGGDGDLLDQIQARHDEQATYSWPGLAHEAHLDRTNLLAMVREQRAALERVEALHRIFSSTTDDRDSCAECMCYWPCPTITALTATEGA